MTKYYIVDPWFANVSIQGRSVKAVFDTGNASNSFISCKKFPTLERVQIPVSQEVITFFNSHIATKYQLSRIEHGITMKDLYKHIRGKIPNDKYIDIMESLGFIFVQSGTGSRNVINLEIVSLEFHIEGIPFPLQARLYCSYIDTRFDILFSMRYITTLLDKRIMISPTRRTKELYTETTSLEKEVNLLSMQIKQALISNPNMDSVDLLISDNVYQERMKGMMMKKSRIDEISRMKFPAREVLLSSPE